MHQHALLTAVSLYASGTYSLETAADHAGVEETSLRDAIARRGVDVATRTPEPVRERRRVAAD